MKRRIFLVSAISLFITIFGFLLCSSCDTKIEIYETFELGKTVTYSIGTKAVIDDKGNDYHFAYIYLPRLMHEAVINCYSDAEEITIDKIIIKKGFFTNELTAERLYDIINSNTKKISDDGVCVICFRDSSTSFVLELNNLERIYLYSDFWAEILIFILVLILMGIILIHVWFASSQWIIFDYISTFIILVMIQFLNAFDIESYSNTYNWCDYAAYYKIGKSFWINGNFNINTCMSAFRGFYFPLLLGIDYKIGSIIGNERVGWYLGNAAIYSIFICVVLPRFIGVFISNNREKRIILLGIIAYIGTFWNGLVLFPFSDLLAFMFLMVSIIGVNYLYEATDFKMLVIGGLATALGGYVAYNIRTIYLFAVFPEFLIVLLLCYRKKCPIILLIMGGVVAIASYPQVLVNKHIVGEMSILVPSQSIIPLQLSQGLWMSRYETWVGNIGNNYSMREYPNYSLVFENKDFIKKYGMIEFQDISQYLIFAVNNLKDLTKVYFNHLISVLSIGFSEMYISKVLDLKSYIYMFINSCILIKGIQQFNNKLYWKKIALVSCILCPSLVISVGALEQRFLVGLYFIFAIFFFEYIAKTIQGPDLCKEIFQDKTNGCIILISSIILLLSYVFFNNLRYL